VKKNKKSRWSRYILELLVVFIGVTAGFLMNSWREDSLEKELEHNYLNSFYTEIQQDRENLDSLQIRIQQKIDELTNFIKATEVAGIPLSEDQAKQIVSKILYIEWFPPSNDTYEDIINSGNLNIISNYQTKESLSSYYSFLEELANVEGYYSDHMNNNVFPYLYKNYHLYRMEFTSPSGYQNVEFTNLYLGVIAFLQENLNMYATALEKNLVLLSLLESELE
jgi:hypothetical protein